MTQDRTVVYVSNMPHEVSSQYVSDCFYEAAMIEPVSVEMLTKGLQGKIRKSCGLAVVKLKSEEDAQKALEKLDGYILLGRPMIVRTDKFVEDDGQYQPRSSRGDSGQIHEDQGQQLQPQPF